jgi:hypothetical protein
MYYIILILIVIALLYYYFTKKDEQSENVRTTTVIVANPGLEKKLPLDIINKESYQNIRDRNVMEEKPMHNPKLMNLNKYMKI